MLGGTSPKAVAKAGEAMQTAATASRSRNATLVCLKYFMEILTPVSWAPDRAPRHGPAPSSGFGKRAPAGLLLDGEIEAVVPLRGHRREAAVRVHGLHGVVEQGKPAGLALLDGHAQILVEEGLAGDLERLPCSDGLLGRRSRSHHAVQAFPRQVGHRRHAAVVGLDLGLRARLEPIVVRGPSRGADDLAAQ